MSIVPESWPCPLCGQPLLTTQRLLVFTFANLEDDRFKLIDDEAVHHDCLWKWPLRDEFIEQWNQVAKKDLGKQWELEIKGNRIVFKKNVGFVVLMIVTAPIWIPLFAGYHLVRGIRRFFTGS